MIPPNKSELVTATEYYSHQALDTGEWWSPRRVYGPLQTVRESVRTISSVDTPNWGAVTGWKHWNPYSKYTKDSQSSLANLTINRIDTYGSTRRPSRMVYENLSIFQRGCYVSGETLVDDQTQKVVGKLQEQLSQAKAQTLVTVAESHKTARHLVDTATRIHKALRALRSFNLPAFGNALGITASRRQTKKWRLRSRTLRPGRTFRQRGTVEDQRVWDFASKTWLEYSYAWKPLLYDFYDHAEALANVLTEKSDAMRVVSARGSSSWREFDKGDTPNSVLTRKSKVRQRQMIEMKIWYRIDKDGNSFANVFGLTNPLTVAWELVPFSFVADWFIPIGTALESLTAYRGLTFLGGSKTTRLETSIEASYAYKGSIAFSSTGTDTYSGSASGTVKYFSMVRSGLSSFPVYGFPKFKDPRSFSHAATAVALLQSIFLNQGRRTGGGFPSVRI